jgi:hypothetical protein
MASEWGHNSLAVGQAAGWCFSRPAQRGFLPVISVRPLSPDFSPSQWSYVGVGEFGIEGISFPQWSHLGVSTIWSNLSDDGTENVYCLLVINDGNQTVEYAFVEADL